MKIHENAPAEQAQNLSKDHKMGTLEKDFDNILAATSEYFGEVLEKLAGGEPADENEDPS